MAAISKLRKPGSDQALPKYRGRAGRQRRELVKSDYQTQNIGVALDNEPYVVYLWLLPEQN